MSINPGQFDWAAAWSHRLGQHGLQANLNRRGIARENFWDNFNDWRELHAQNGYPDRLVERIGKSTRPEDSLLDIGAGAGGFAFPLAKLCRRVTAVEPSPGQVDRLLDRIGRDGVKNLTVIPDRWEDLKLTDIGQHDIVLAAYSFEMDDIREALDKMARAAVRDCFLIHTGGHDLIETNRRLLGVEPGPDYIYLYNILYDLGYRPNVEMFVRSYSLPLAVQLGIFGFNPGLDEEQQGKLAAYLEDSGQLFENNGQKWIKRQHKDALIWINKEV